MIHSPNTPVLIDIWMVEDNAAYREKIVDLLNNISGMRCVAAFSDFESVQALVESRMLWDPPDIVLMDHALPGLNGTEGLVLLKSHLPEVPIVMLTHYDDVDIIYEAFCAGASGYLLKNAPLDQIVLAIRETYQGGTLLPAPVARKVLRFFNEATPQHDYFLTAREQEILQLMGDGLSQKEIADHLSRSNYTVANHIRSIYRKLHVNSGLQAVAKAYREGLIHQATNWLKRRKSS